MVAWASRPNRITKQPNNRLVLGSVSQKGTVPLQGTRISVESGCSPRGLYPFETEPSSTVTDSCNGLCLNDLRQDASAGGAYSQGPRQQRVMESDLAESVTVERGDNGTGPILTRWEVFDNLWACLVPQESLRAEWCFMFSTGVLRMQVFEKAGDYEAFERVLKETLEEAPMRVCATSDAQPLAYAPLARA